MKDESDRGIIKETKRNDRNKVTRELQREVLRYREK